METTIVYWGYIRDNGKWKLLWYLGLRVELGFMVYVWAQGDVVRRLVMAITGVILWLTGFTSMLRANAVRNQSGR